MLKDLCARRIKVGCCIWLKWSPPVGIASKSTSACRLTAKWRDLSCRFFRALLRQVPRGRVGSLLFAGPLFLGLLFSVKSREAVFLRLLQERSGWQLLETGFQLLHLLASLQCSLRMVLQGHQALVHHLVHTEFL